MDSLEQRVKEIQDRCRRVETRLTRFLETQGFDTQRKMPIFRGNVVEVPSMECSIADIISVLPADIEYETVWVTHQGVKVCVVGMP